jgi:uncharacterized protein YlzI (FlbEa/FlbD family)
MIKLMQVRTNKGHYPIWINPDEISIIQNEPDGGSRITLRGSGGCLIVTESPEIVVGAIEKVFGS